MRTGAALVIAVVAFAGTRASAQADLSGEWGTDPVYLEEPFVRTTNWGQNLTQELAGVTAEAVDEIPGRPDGFVPHHLPGRNPWLKDAAREFGIPEDALRGGRETTYPEYRTK